MTEKRITEAEIAAWTSESHHMPLRAGWALAADYHSRIKRLLSERREREGKLAELDQLLWHAVMGVTLHGDHARQVEHYARQNGIERDAAIERAEAAEATLARVREWGRINERILDERMIERSFREALTTPVVSSDRLTPGDRSYVEDARRRKRSDLGAAAAFNLIDIIDRLAPSVSHQEDKGNE